MNYRISVLNVRVSDEKHEEQVNEHLEQWSKEGWLLTQTNIRHTGVGNANAEYTFCWHRNF
jgi:hypothetical protein